MSHFPHLCVHSPEDSPIRLTSKFSEGWWNHYIPPEKWTNVPLQKEPLFKGTWFHLNQPSRFRGNSFSFSLGKVLLMFQKSGLFLTRLLIVYPTIYCFCQKNPRWGTISISSIKQYQSTQIPRIDETPSLEDSGHFLYVLLCLLFHGKQK